MEQQDNELEEYLSKTRGSSLLRNGGESKLTAFIIVAISQLDKAVRQQWHGRVTATQTKPTTFRLLHISSVFTLTLTLD